MISFLKFFVILFLTLFFSIVANAEIDKRKLVINNFMIDNYKIEILQYPYFAGAMGSYQGPASFKIQNLQTDKVIFFPIEFYTNTLCCDGNLEWSSDEGMLYRIVENEKFFLEDPEFSADDLVNMHKYDDLSEVLKIQKEPNIQLSEIANCDENDYYTKVLDKKFVHESSDKCFKIHHDDHVLIFDIDFDETNEIIILNKFEGQRWYPELLIFELNGERHSSIPNNFDAHSLDINLSKKIISTYASGGCCNNSFSIYKIEVGEFIPKLIASINDDEYSLYKCDQPENKSIYNDAYEMLDDGYCTEINTINE